MAREEGKIHSMISRNKEDDGTSVSTITRLEKEGTVSVMDLEDTEDADLSQLEVVIIYNFDIAIDEYKKILTGMARYTIKGRLHVILTREDATIAASLAQVLQQCGQQAPESLKQLCWKRAKGIGMSALERVCALQTVLKTLSSFPIPSILR